MPGFDTHPNEFRIALLQWSIVVLSIVAATFLVYTGKANAEIASGVFFTALGFAGAKISSTSGRARRSDQDEPPAGG